MKLVTLDGKHWEIKYQQNKEVVTVKNQTASFNYPNFVGSKVKQNSTSSDIYELNFAIHRTVFVGFKESMKKILLNEADAVNDSEYGKLTHLILVHDSFGAIRGLVIGDIKYGTSSLADIPVSCTFQEHTADESEEKKDIEQENAAATEAIDSETEVGELEETDRPALLQLLDDLNAIYDNIQNSAVIAALNDLESALNDALLNYQKVMNAVKKILSLPNQIFAGFRNKIDFFKKQANAIKNIPALTANMFKFNASILSFNLSQANRIPFLRKLALRKKSGVKTAPIN